mmetsp:Transcript_31136/g.87278  ORF Transcript_31136/g.87278 Transcript_31136/m.87278 type:complete len:247 (+) Transcript_31136:2094-2834(+)
MPRTCGGQLPADLVPQLRPHGFELELQRFGLQARQEEVDEHVDGGHVQEHGQSEEGLLLQEGRDGGSAVVQETGPTRDVLSDPPVPCQLVVDWPNAVHGHHVLDVPRSLADPAPGLAPLDLGLGIRQLSLEGHDGCRLLCGHVLQLGLLLIQQVCELLHPLLEPGGPAALLLQLLDLCARLTQAPQRPLLRSLRLHQLPFEALLLLAQLAHLTLEVRVGGPHAVLRLLQLLLGPGDICREAAAVCL